MANPEHLAKLREGVASRNRWISEYTKTRSNREVTAKGHSLYRWPDLYSELIADIEAAGNSIVILSESRFRNADLSGADLSGANLVWPDFSETNLKGADLSNANLGGTLLRGACLGQANLIGAKLDEADLSGADLSGADLGDADLSKALLDGANLANANLSDVNLINAQLRGANLGHSNLEGATITEADFSKSRLSHENLHAAYALDADFSGADMREANLSESYFFSGIFERAALSRSSLIDASLKDCRFSNANLAEAELQRANLSDTDLTDANLRDANLGGAYLVRANLKGAQFDGSRVYGASVWDVLCSVKTSQRNLVITPHGEQTVTVDDLKVAQFMYLILKNDEIRRVIETITSKVVLILGRFTDERKPVLEILRSALRRLGYAPVMFDFDKPASRDLTETVSTLAHISRFVVADITDAKAIPQELQKIVPSLPSLPVHPIILQNSDEYGMFEDFGAYLSVSAPLRYKNPNHLVEEVLPELIEAAQVKEGEIRDRRRVFQERGGS